MKIPQHKTPPHLKEKIDAKIRMIECWQDLVELFFQNSPKTFIEFLSNKKEKK